MKKLDLKKTFAPLYKASTAKAGIVKVPKLRNLMVEGQGDPNNNPAFEEAVGTLYSLSYTLKFLCKLGKQQTDWSVMPLEGLWWADDMNDFANANRSKWKWTLMIMQPSLIDKKSLKAAQDELVRKKKVLPRLKDVRLEDMTEGACAQIMHVGPYSAEGPTIAKLHAFIADQGKSLRGKHREIYLGDPRCSTPEKLRTIIRQPMG